MSKLSKKNKTNIMPTGMFRSLNPTQLIAEEQAGFTSEKGFTPEAAEIAAELSSTCNRLNTLKASGKKMPKIIGLLETKIKEATEQLEALGYSVESLGNGSYWVKPNEDQQGLVRVAFN